jgi:4-amino-4-deoxy-L-arabinose transferase-like glycosyltransferase
MITGSWRAHPLAWILSVGALVRVGLWLAWANWSPLINHDAHNYQELAEQLATTGQYANESGVLISLRPPLYPATVAVIYHGFGLNSDGAVRVVQAILGLLTALIVYRLSFIAYSRKVALWATALTAFYPSLLAYANLLLSETLFTFLSVLFTWLVCEALCQRRPAVLAGAGVAMGLAALTRSIMLLFLPILAAVIFLSWNGTWPRRIFAAAVPVAVFAMVVAPWAVRNTRLQKTFTVIDVMGGRNAMMGNYEHTPMERSWATISDVRDEHQWFRVLRREYPNDKPRTQGQIDKLALRHAITFVLANPWLTLKRDIVKFFNFWQLERELLAAAKDGYFGNISLTAKLILAAIICGSYAFVMFTGIFGACCYPPVDRRLHWFMVGSIVFPCIIHTLIFAHARYHLPVIPLIATYAAAAIVHWREIWKHRCSKGFILAVALCLLMFTGWLREFALVDFSSVKGLVS